MGYQESFVRGRSLEDFERIVSRVRELGKEYYDGYGTWPAAVITFAADHEPFRAGEKALHFIGERYLQDEGGHRLLDYMNGEYHLMSNLDDMKRLADDAREFRSFNMEICFAEDVDPDGIWLGSGEVMDADLEPFRWVEDPDS